MGKRTVLGIDIGYDQLKLALVTDGVAVKTALAQMPENLLKDGRITSLDTLAGLIRETMKENGIKANTAAVVLPNEAVYVKNVDMPMMTEEQLMYNLPFEFHDYISGEIQDYLFDYAVLDVHEPGADTDGAAQDGGQAQADAEGIEGEGGEPVLHLMAVGIERVIIEDLEAMLRKAGLKLIKTAPALCAYISLIRSQYASLSQMADEYGILDIGHHAITMYMYKNDRYVATREFEMGLSSLDDLIADKYGIDRHVAHTYVLSNFEDCLESEECVNYFDNIAVELMRAINFYEFSNQDSNLNDIWICGGGAVIVALVRSIYETLETNLHRSSELLLNGAEIPQYNMFVQAIGITLEI